jgi:hypothetical protein
MATNSKNLTKIHPAEVDAAMRHNAEAHDPDLRPVCRRTISGSIRMATRKSLRPVLTALCSLLLTLIAWVIIVGLLDRRTPLGDNQLWAISLWITAIGCSMLVANSRFSVRPVLASTIAFGVFGVAYFMCEGPIFGNANQGGEPATTSFVFWNLVCLPLGVFLASEVGACLRGMRRRTVVS